MNKTLVRLAKKYVLADSKTKESIIKTKTAIKYINQFNWFIDMLQGDEYKLELTNEYYPEWIKVKTYFDSCKVKAKNIVCGKAVDVVILGEYDCDRSEACMGRNRFIVRNEDITY